MTGSALRELEPEQLS